MFARNGLFIMMFACSLAAAQQTATPRPSFTAFEVATVKPVGADPKPGRYIRLDEARHFVAVNYTLKQLIAAAYDLNPKAISGGPDWVAVKTYEITGVVPASPSAQPPGLLPDHAEQMRMLRALLTERFELGFHREPKEMAMYAMRLAKSGSGATAPKLTPTVAAPGDPVVMGPGVAYPQRISLPARNATVGDLVSLLQRAVVDRPIVDETGLTGRYDFTLEWAPNETEFGGDVPAAPEAGKVLPLFGAIQQELGLRLEPLRAPVSVLVIDRATQPTGN